MFQPNPRAYLLSDAGFIQRGAVCPTHLLKHATREMRFSPAFNALLLSCLMHNPRDLEKGCSVAPRSCSSSTDDVCVETGG